jgi:protein-L-isoaspartate(D-aspartate) O-methyltransferase
MMSLSPVEERRGRATGSVRDVETLHLLMRLRARGVSDKAVWRAFEAVPRGYFAPGACRDLAGWDVALPTGCGQIMGAPSDLALALAALELRKEHHALDIGTGSGYAAALMGHLVQKVISIERFRALVLEAKARLDGCAIANVEVLQGDALADIPAAGSFQRVFIDFAIDEPPAAVATRLVEGGICVFARPDPDKRMCHIVRAEKLADGGWKDELIGLTRVGPPIPGIARHL